MNVYSNCLFFKSRIDKVYFLNLELIWCNEFKSLNYLVCKSSVKSGAREFGESDLYSDRFRIDWMFTGTRIWVSSFWDIYLIRGLRAIATHFEMWNAMNELLWQSTLFYYFCPIEVSTNGHKLMWNYCWQRLVYSNASLRSVSDQFILSYWKYQMKLCVCLNVKPSKLQVFYV